MNLFKVFIRWWYSLVFDPFDPRYGRGDIKIVALGGGTGISNLLRGIKKYSKSLSAVVAVSDSGRSSGIIRKVFRILPPGDLRKCLAALSDDWQELNELFEYRFPKGSGFLTDHALGNIWIAALAKKYNSFEKSIGAIHGILNITGNVYPSTLDNVQIGASYTDNTRKIGEDKIPFQGKKIRSIFLTKKNIKPYKPAIKAISEAELIIIGPGSLFTSIIPNLLISKIKEALIANGKAIKVFVANVSTERGETENFSITDHIDAIEKHCGGQVFDYVLVNSKIVKKSKKTALLGEINNITTNVSFYKNYKIISRDMVDKKNPLYHDKEKLSKELLLLYNDCKNNKKRISHE